MRTRGRLAIAHLALLATAALVLGACTSAAGPLGSPSSPTPTGNASVAPPSGDVAPGTPDPASPSGAQKTASPSRTEGTPPATVPPPTPTAVASTTPAPTGTLVVRAYFFAGTATNSDGISTGLTPVLREVPKTQGVLAVALRALLEGPSTQELRASPALRTEIPDGTRLLSVAVSSGVATVKLSSEFNANTANRTLGSLNQIVHTATQFESVRTVDFQFEGGPYPIAVGGPLGREDSYNQLPPIFIDHPAWGASAGNPITVSGLANVYEATFRVQVKDASGKVLADKQVQASCGTGCRGEFSTSVGYKVGSAQWGTLRAFDLSAIDGTPQDVTEYPVWLIPAG